MKLPHRIVVLVSVIQELQHLISEENIHEYLFLYCHKYSCNCSYDFILVNNKPYCITIYEDKKLLVGKQILQDLPNWTVSPELPRFVKKLNMIEKLSLQKLKNDFEQNHITEVLTSKVYDSYFQYDTISDDQHVLYTIGYEGLSLEQYLNRLLKYKVNCLCDVRRNPYSQKYGFSKAELIKALSLINISYIHIPELGVTSSLRQNLNNDIDYYNLLKQYENDILPMQIVSIKLLEDLLLQHKRIAITCFEAKLSHCHRNKIANFMSKKTNPYMITHI